MKFKLITSVFAISLLFLGGCASFSTQEWKETEYDAAGNVVKETTLKLNASNLRNKMALDTQAEVAILETEKEIAETNARSCQKIAPEKLDTWGVGDREQYFKYLESCISNPVMQVAWMADEMAENIREAAGQAGPSGKIAQEFAKVQAVHEQEVTNRWRVGGNVATVGIGIWGVTSLADSIGRNAGNRYGDVSIEASNSGSIEGAGGAGGEAAGGEGLASGGGRSQVFNFGDGNNIGASGAGPVSAASGKNVFQQTPFGDSNMDDFQRETPQSSFIDDSGDGGGNTLGF